MSPSDVVIVSAKRTPIGAFLGALSPLSAEQLGSAAIKAALEAGSVAAADVQEVIMGCVLPAGQGQAPARQASLGAGLSLEVTAEGIERPEQLALRLSEADVAAHREFVAALGDSALWCDYSPVG